MSAPLHVGTPPVVRAGERFGMLLVLQEVPDPRHGRHYLCRCDCGEEAVVRASALRKGQQSCSACVRRPVPPPVVEIGARYGRLTILQEVERADRRAQRNRLYLAECDCGNRLIVRPSGLKSARRDCGAHALDHHAA